MEGFCLHVLECRCNTTYAAFTSCRSEGMTSGSIILIGFSSSVFMNQSILSDSWEPFFTANSVVANDIPDLQSDDTRTNLSPHSFTLESTLTPGKQKPATVHHGEDQFFLVVPPLRSRGREEEEAHGTANPTKTTTYSSSDQCPRLFKARLGLISQIRFKHQSGTTWTKLRYEWCWRHTLHLYVHLQMVTHSMLDPWWWWLGQSISWTTGLIVWC